MKADLPKLQKYLRKVFRNENIRLVMPPKKTDMAEVFIGDEQIATLTVDDEDGDRCYFLEMPILEIDLDDA
jgi:hypothetical protein